LLAATTRARETRLAVSPTRWYSPFSLDAGAERRWLTYPFPGNVRELRNIAIRLTTKHPGRRLTAAELEPEFDLESNTPAEARPGEGDVVVQAVRHLERSRGVQLDAMLAAMERSYIEAALRITRGNVSQAAKLLGVNRTTLYSRMNTDAGDPQGGSPAALPPDKNKT